MTTTQRKTARRVRMRTARPLAPEDIRRGDYVALLSVLKEETPFLTSADDARLARFVMLPEADDVMISCIVEVCLPFVLAKTPKGDFVTFDVRRHRLARLSRRFGEGAFWRLRPTCGTAGRSPCADDD